MLRRANRYPRPMQPLQPLSPIELTRKVRQHDDDLPALYELVERLEDKVDAGFEQVDTQLGGIRTQLTEVDGKLDVLLQRLEIRRPSREVSAVTQTG